MIYIKTEEDYMLDIDDSNQYIIWRIENEFSTISEFRKCMEINKSSYWGDCLLTNTEEHYFKWINKIAELTLKE